MDYSADVKTARMTTTRDQIDAGAGPGVLEIGTAGMALVLSTHTLQDPCGTVTGAVLTLTGAPWSDAADNDGTAAEARIKDSDGNDKVIGLTVGVSTDVPLPNVIVDNVSLSTGQTVNINSGSITHG